MRPILAEAVGLARRALLELQPTGVGEHLGVTAEDDHAATHHFEATLPGYRGWQWAVVVAAPPEAEYATVSESALLPGPTALVAPEFVPWDQRVRPGDLAPGDLLAPPPNDPRLVPGYIATGDPVVDEVAEEIGLGRSRVLSLQGRAEAAERWFTEYGPDTDMARSAPSTCGVCGFFVPLAGSLRAGFGVCANAMGADGHVVHAEYGCGAHSDTVVPGGTGSPQYEAYDDSAVELIPTESLDTQANADASVAQASDDVVAGQVSDDASAGQASDDVVAGRVSDDASAGQAGDGAVAGQAGNEAVAGQAGDDVVAGQAGNEAVAGQAGDDASAAHASDDAVAGQASDDVVAETTESGDTPEIAGGGDGAADASSTTVDGAAPTGGAPVSEADSGAAAEVSAVDMPTDTAPSAADPDDSPAQYSDAWAVSAVRVQRGEAGASGASEAL
ncbi:hypothetical protein CRH09_04140 [Nocardia terpenica]|uniref:DUF3027 domain-containing protein n=1 Tax=Nocardia terpenica TaxID=455432 RepID=A0A291RDU7_9NOCA|nr:hypothetical protein CRH09_04140 [Nocardia terpenica]